MKKRAVRKSDPDMLKEYDFRKGVRGKYAERYAQGSNVVVLPPDLAQAFPNSDAVEDALRGLVSLAERTTKRSSPKRLKKRQK
jgi:hypothetical protein